MKKYLAFTKINLLHSIMEVESLALWIVVGLLEVALFMFLWTGGEKDVIAGYSQSQLIGYYVLVFLLEPILGWYIFWTVKDDVTSGNIQNSLSRPFNYFIHIVFRELGYRIVRCFFQVLTAIILIAFLSNFASFSVTWQSFLLSIPTILLAILLNLLMQFTMGCATFFWTETYFLQDLNWMLMSLFGGRFLPTVMFPAFLQSFAKYNPYAFMTALNIDVLNNNINTADYLRSILICVLWCSLFAAISSQLWRIGCKKYSGFGK